MENPWCQEAPRTNLRVVYSGFSPGTANRLKHTRDSRQATVGCIECIHKWPLQPICHHCTEVGLKSRICLFAACANRPYGSLLTAVLNSVKQLQGMSAATCSSCQMMWLKPARSPSQASQADRVTLKEPQLSQQVPVM